MTEDYLHLLLNKNKYMPLEKEAWKMYIYQYLERDNYETFDLPNIPLGTPDKLLNPDFKKPICMIYGEKDWIRKKENEFGYDIVQLS